MNSEEVADVLVVDGHSESIYTHLQLEHIRLPEHLIRLDFMVESDFSTLSAMAST